MIIACKHGWDPSRCIHCAEEIETRRWSESQKSYKQGWTDGLAACAAGPWHDVAETPPHDEAVYLVQYPDLRYRGQYTSEVVMWHRDLGWEGDKRFPPSRWAEIREPDHIPDATKMVEEKVESNE
jgi:hypothetical protein